MKQCHNIVKLKNKNALILDQLLLRNNYCYRLIILQCTMLSSARLGRFRFTHDKVYPGKRCQTKSDKALFTRLMIAESILQHIVYEKTIKDALQPAVSPARFNGPPSRNSLGDCLIKLIDSGSSCRHKSRVARPDTDARHVFATEIVALPWPNGDASYGPVYSMADEKDYEIAWIYILYSFFFFHQIRIVGSSWIKEFFYQCFHEGILMLEIIQ